MGTVDGTSKINKTILSAICDKERRIVIWRRDFTEVVLDVYNDLNEFKAVRDRI